MLRDTTARFAIVVAGLSCLFAGSQVEAGEVRWNKDIKQAAEQSSQQKKPMMVLVSAPWCGYCQKMLKTTFKDEKLVAHLNDCFVPVYLDADKNAEWVEQLQVEGLPTTLIISPEMKVVKRLSGYQSAGQLNGQIMKLCKHTRVISPPKPVPVSLPASAAPKAVAGFQETCLVSLRDDGKLVKGKDRWSSRHKGQVVWFASADHKRRFDANPKSYWPVADGVCLVSQRKEQKTRQGEPVLAMIYADHLWFFADEAHQTEFTNNPKSYLNHINSTR